MINKSAKILFAIKIIVILALLGLYMSITILDKPPRPFDMVKIGMTKHQIIKLVGEPDKPDRKMKTSLWTYRIHGSGIFGYISPLIIMFDKDNLVIDISS